MGQLYTVKTARTRWQRELGNLGAAELGRLGLRSRPVTLGAQVGAPNAKGVRPIDFLSPRADQSVRVARRRLYQTGTDLTPEQLGRHRRLNELQAEQTKNLFFTQVETPMGYAGSAGFRIAPPRKEVDPFLGRIGGVIGQKYDPRTRGSIERSVLQHELAESALSQGLVNNMRESAPAAPALKQFASVSAKDLPTRGKLTLPGVRRETQTDLRYPAAQMAGHMGPGAPLQDMLYTFRDPAARRYMRRMRTGPAASPEDKAVFEKMKQFGATPAAPIAPGGRQHRALERFAADQLPIGPQSSINRIASGQNVPAFTARTLPGMPGMKGYLKQLGIKKIQVGKFQRPEGWERDLTGIMASTRPDASIPANRPTYPPPAPIPLPAPQTARRAPQPTEAGRRFEMGMRRRGE